MNISNDLSYFKNDSIPKETENLPFRPDYLFGDKVDLSEVVKTVVN